LLKVIQVESGLGIELTARGGKAEVRDKQLAGTFDTGIQQVATHAGVVPAAASEVYMQIYFTVFPGDVSGKVGDFHLFLERLVHILLGGGIQETESGL
jgi:hypothetical protein